MLALRTCHMVAPIDFLAGRVAVRAAFGVLLDVIVAFGDFCRFGGREAGFVVGAGEGGVAQAWYNRAHAQA